MPIFKNVELLESSKAWFWVGGDELLECHDKCLSPFKSTIFHVEGITVKSSARILKIVFYSFER